MSLSILSRVVLKLGFMQMSVCYNHDGFYGGKSRRNRSRMTRPHHHLWRTLDDLAFCWAIIAHTFVGQSLPTHQCCLFPPSQPTGQCSGHILLQCAFCSFDVPAFIAAEASHQNLTYDQIRAQKCWWLLCVSYSMPSVTTIDRSSSPAWKHCIFWDQLFLLTPTQKLGTLTCK